MALVLLSMFITYGLRFEVDNFDTLGATAGSQSQGLLTKLGTIDKLSILPLHWHWLQQFAGAKIPHL